MHTRRSSLYEAEICALLTLELTIAALKLKGGHYAHCSCRFDDN